MRSGKILRDWAGVVTPGRPGGGEVRVTVVAHGEGGSISLKYDEVKDRKWALCSVLKVTSKGASDVCTAPISLPLPSLPTLPEVHEVRIL